MSDDSHNGDSTRRRHITGDTRRSRQRSSRHRTPRRWWRHPARLKQPLACPSTWRYRAPFIATGPLCASQRRQNSHASVWRHRSHPGSCSSWTVAVDVMTAAFSVRTPRCRLFTALLTAFLFHVPTVDEAPEQATPRLADRSFANVEEGKDEETLQWVEDAEKEMHRGGRLTECEQCKWPR